MTARLRSEDCEIIHLRWERGTAGQRNAGIDRASGSFIALIDDDIRLADDFFVQCLRTLKNRPDVGAVCGLIVNQVIDPTLSTQWKWAQRLRCFGTFEPGRFDWSSGHPVPRYLGGIHEDERSIEVMGAGCAVWKREVFDRGLRFDPWFSGYGMLEDVHLSVRASRSFELLEVGKARCSHLQAAAARPDPEELAFRSVVSYRYLFRDVVRTPTMRQQVRWWYAQLIDLIRLLRHVRFDDPGSLAPVRGKLRGFYHAVRTLPLHGPRPQVSQP